ncbi:MAG TPA: glutamate--tRNA ligase family protein [Chakrabartia sp.]|nr:glutamate--tRNA ligase family protein [Chakrabartia sp.]
MPLTTRFAPSPTGLLHLGHAWSAVQAHDLARTAGGRFILRVEDIDETRCRPEFPDAIFRDLVWLGLDWDGPVLIQSERGALYRAAVQQLAEQGLAYRCWCTRAEIEEAASAPHDGGPPRYPRTCKHRTQPFPTGPHCWRIDASAAGAPELDDFVIERKDALSSYMLACTLDDAQQGVTDIVRGVDLEPLTAGQALLQRVFGWPTPRYHHHPLIGTAAGKRLAKRNKAPTLAAMREAGMDGRALAADLRRGVFPVGFGVLAD